VKCIADRRHVGQQRRAESLGASVQSAGHLIRKPLRNDGDQRGCSPFARNGGDQRFDLYQALCEIRVYGVFEEQPVDNYNRNECRRRWPAVLNAGRDRRLFLV